MRCPLCTAVLLFSRALACSGTVAEGSPGDLVAIISEIHAPAEAVVVHSQEKVTPAFEGGAIARAEEIIITQGRVQLLLLPNFKLLDLRAPTNWPGTADRSTPQKGSFLARLLEILRAQRLIAVGAGSKATPAPRESVQFFGAWSPPISAPGTAAQPRWNLYWCAPQNRHQSFELQVLAGPNPTDSILHKIPLADCRRHAQGDLATYVIQVDLPRPELKSTTRWLRIARLLPLGSEWSNILPTQTPLSLDLTGQVHLEQAFTTTNQTSLRLANICCLEASGAHVAALGAYLRLLEQSPDYPPVHLALAQYFQVHGHPALADWHGFQYLRLRPDHERR